MQKLQMPLIAALALAACLATAARLAAQSPAEERLLAVLKSGAAADAKCNACRELKTAGTEKSIPVLAALLTDAETSHAARIALESMPYPAAGAALREAAGKTAGLVKSGILDSLGQRGDVEALPLLATALDDPDPQVLAAAATALAKIGTAEAVAALVTGRAKAPEMARETIGLALLLGADRLLASGRRGEAEKIYGQLSQPGESRVVRAAALRGRLRAAGPQATQAVAEGLASDDVLLRNAAAGGLQDLSTANFHAVVASMAKLPSASQAAVLAATGIRGDKSLAALVLEAAKGSDKTVQLAAVRALGVLDDVAALPRLVELAQEKSTLGEAARQSLEAICGPEIDQRILGLVQAEQDPARRAGWIALVQSRQPPGAAAILLVEATHASPEVRRRAMAALAKLAGPKDIRFMLAGVLKAAEGPERDSAERAVVVACRQIPEAAKRAELIAGAVRAATPADRTALLPLWGRFGGPAAKDAIQLALESKLPEFREAGLRAICNWPDASVAGQLLQLFRSANTDAQRRRALQAYIRVSALPGAGSDAQRLAMLQQAMHLAGRDEQRRYVLERVSAVRTVEALRFVAPYLDQPAMAQSACKSIVELAHHKELREPNQKEFQPALEKVLLTSRDQATVEQARRFLGK